MIKMAVSYFYQIRFFKPYMVPFSTAVWDPKWFHKFGDQNNVFVDRNKVLNGMRMEVLMPGRTCSDLCRGVDNCSTKDPSQCEFLNKYTQQLRIIPFQVFAQSVEARARAAMEILGVNQEPIAVFIVHEAPNNPCSERGALLTWLRENDVDANELSYPIQNYYREVF